MRVHRGFAEKEDSLLSYFREYPVYEEYAAFLLDSERIFSAEEVFQKGIPLGDIPCDEIKSRRVIEVLKKTKKCKDKISYASYYKAMYQIVDAECPRAVDGKIIFPIIRLERDLKKYGHEKYATEVLKGRPKNVL